MYSDPHGGVLVEHTSYYYNPYIKLREYQQETE